MRTCFLLPLPSSALAAILVLTSLSLPLRAAAPGSGTGLGALAPSAGNLSAGPGASFAFPADLEGGEAGDVSIVRYFLDGSYDVPSAPGSFLTLNASYEYADFDWSDADLLDESHRLAFSAIGLRRLGESNWGIFGYGQIGFAAEKAEDLDRGFSATLLAGPAYSFSRNLSVTVGSLVNVELEDSTDVFPVASVNWRINEQWRLRTLNGAILSYAPDAERLFQVDFFGEYRTRGIRLQRQLLPDNSVGRPAVEEREIAAGVGLAWQLREGLVLQGFAEYLFNRRWRFRDDDRDFRTVEVESTPQVGVRLDYAF